MRLPVWSRKAWIAFGVVGVLLVAAIQITSKPVAAPSPAMDAADAPPAAAPGLMTVQSPDRALTRAGKYALEQGRTGKPLARLKVALDGQDAHGRPAASDLLTLTWATTDLEQVAFGTIDQYRLLDLATVTPDDPQAMKSFSEWCWKPDALGLRLTPRLCSSGGVREAQLALAGE